MYATGDISTTNTGKEYAFLNGQPLAAWHIEGPLPVLAPPAMSPATNTYPGSVTVTLGPAPPGVTIYYTIDGGQNYAPYTGPFILTTTTTVSAVSTKAFHQNSGSTTHVFTIDSGSQAMSSGGGDLTGGGMQSAQSMLPGSAAANKKVKPRPRAFEDPTIRAAVNAIEAGKDISTSTVGTPDLFIKPIIDAAEAGIAGEVR